jgi:hypothetical protein
LQFSKKGLLGLSFGNRVEVYKDPTVHTLTHPYMKNEVMEDRETPAVLPLRGCAWYWSRCWLILHAAAGSCRTKFRCSGSKSLPDCQAGEEAEVKLLMDKVAPELITVDREALAGVNVATLQEKLGGEEQEAVRETQQHSLTPDRS